MDARGWRRGTVFRENWFVTCRSGRGTAAFAPLLTVEPGSMPLRVSTRRSAADAVDVPLLILAFRKHPTLPPDLTALDAKMVERSGRR